ncbi:hypothetical protein GJU43_14095 [Flavobacterium sp. LC2016-23]|uniref:hypothetical protein n=1 Tax=Flavobacterium sp. LC2016-23 TaxID=2666330 RepID=UPI0012AFB19D|nr:hypothetical protein [Flavobacterium sp. LC2016-23]MRX40415.1 hypothetical protein [Flavobacterium sp. LC2016-23]
MNTTKQIKKLKRALKELKTVVAKDTITLTDNCDPNLRAEISLRNGVLLIEKIRKTVSENEDTEIIIIDNK